ncbi:MAG: hypothetical protein EPN82_00995 [Bacteroidetes bacterium]|nr:MAG: hypothetical protein EPN82_00995 [Bacteroidota bacterium]
MKTFSILFLIFILNILNSQSQIPQGNRLLGLGISARFDLQENLNSGNSHNNYQSFSLIPSYGYFISVNKLIGLELSLSYSHNDNVLDNIIYGMNVDNQIYSISISPYYQSFYILANQLYFFGKFGINIGYDNNLNKNGGNENKSETLNAGFYFIPGLSYLINAHLMVNAGLGSFSFAYSSNKNIKRKNFQMYFLPSNLSIGLNYLW